MRTFVLAFFLLSLEGNCQSEMTTIEIEENLIKTVQDTSKLEKVTIVEIEESGEVDSVRFYFDTNGLKYIYHYRFKGAYSYGEGPPYADIHTFKKMLLINGELRHLSIIYLTEYYLDYKKGQKSVAEKESVFFSDAGDCLKYYRRTKVEGKSLAVETTLRDMILNEESCIYCPYDKDYVKEYLLMLKKKQEF